MKGQGPRRPAAAAKDKPTRGYGEADGDNPDAASHALTAEMLHKVEVAAAKRDEEGALRDRRAQARDVAAGVLEKRAAARAQADLNTATRDLARAASGRAAATANRTRARGDRDLAAIQRAESETDRRSAAVDRRQAAEHDGAAALTRPTPQQRHRAHEASSRDMAAARRDQEATSRDLAAGKLDRAAELRAATDGRSAAREVERASMGRTVAAENRAQAVGDRRIAAQDRRMAENDRKVAAEDRIQSSRALQFQALHDGLTGLPNRTLLLDRVNRELIAATRDRRMCGLLVLDMDQFKYVNDSLGYEVGDQLLIECATRISQNLDPHDTLARLNGDEFAILPADAGDMDGIVATAAKVVAALAEPFSVGGVTINASASIGVAAFPDHAPDASTLMRRADVAMYVAKQSHSGYAVYSVEHEENLGRRMSLLGELREAIASNEIVLYYQPQIDMNARRTVAVEALVRWVHPRYGLVPPAEFIPAAEASDLIGPLTRWILNDALRQLQSWDSQGIVLNASVNISAANLLDPALPTLVGDLLRVWTIAAHRLTLEITETTVIAGDVDETLQRLRALGVGLSIDDFGTGYASLTYLRRLPVTELKLDRSFVGTMATNSDDATIVRPAIGLGHSLGLRVVAEGVEDEPTWDMLAGFDCDLAQGYYMARPMAPANLVEWLGESPWGLTATPALSAAVAGRP